jgi:hypothetical protein
MDEQKQDLKTLIDFVNDIANQKGNEWFKAELKDKISLQIHSTEIEEIYEYCIRQILKDQATKFYSDFKLIPIKDKLIEDYIRMEQFRRDDRFEDFCLALFQQIEGIVNYLSNDEVVKYFQLHYLSPSHKIKNKDTSRFDQKQLWQLIFFGELENLEIENKLKKSMIDWDFSERYKSILYYFYFNKIVYNYYDFQTIFFLGNDLYQSRNLNHRGGKISNKQKIIIEKVTSNSHKYYFKFLGYLEDFTSKINAQIIYP